LVEPYLGWPYELHGLALLLAIDEPRSGLHRINKIINMQAMLDKKNIEPEPRR
jgi:hypothetical protein